MKKQLSQIVPALGLLAGLAVLPVQAQTNHTLKVQIPFAFSVGKKALPAGEYTVVENLSAQHGTIMGNQLGSAMFLAHQLQAPSTPKTAKLIFNRYGNQFYLTQVWNGLTNIGRELPMCRAERELRRQNSPREIAMVTAFHQ